MLIPFSIFGRAPGRFVQGPSAKKASRKRRTTFALSVQALEDRQLLSTFTVTSVHDSGPGTLRQAILSADSQSGPSTIDFSIGTGRQTISPVTPLPTITGQVKIDGTSQPGYSGTPLIAINGSKAGPNAEGLTITGNNGDYVGLAIAQFSGDGMLVEGNGNTIASDYVGLRATGSADGNSGSGIIIRNASNNTIGSLTSGDGDVISANGWRGVWIDGASSSGNVVEGNKIGTNIPGTVALPNGGDGVSIVNAPNNTIGGTAAGASNLISGDTRVGIWIDGTTASGNFVEGNMIGTNAKGSQRLGNGLSGVMTEGAPNNTIGGSATRRGEPHLGQPPAGSLARWLGLHRQSNPWQQDRYQPRRYLRDPQFGRWHLTYRRLPNRHRRHHDSAGNLISGNDRVGIWIANSDAGRQRHRGQHDRHQPRRYQSPWQRPLWCDDRGRSQQHNRRQRTRRGEPLSRATFCGESGSMARVQPAIKSSATRSVPTSPERPRSPIRAMVSP